MPGEPTGPGPPGKVRDWLLVALTFGSGAVDAISFLGLGRVFTANMTGNLVLLGLAAGRAEGSEAVRAAVSVVAFCAGVFAASRLVRGVDEGRSWSAGVTRALGFEVLAQAGLLGGWVATAGHPGAGLEAGLVALSAVAMGTQSGAVAGLRVSGVSTTYVTGTLTGLIGQLASSTGARTDWARRALVLAGLLAGAACSAVLLVAARPLAPALPLVVTLGVVATGMGTERWRARR